MLPPRTLNVQIFAESRASELQSLHSIVANRLHSDFRSKRSKRRRTTGHDDRVAKNRFRKKRKVGAPNSAKKTDALEEDKKDVKLSRRIRRRIELKKNPESGFVTSGDLTKRLRTHVWHAKRFTMEKLWGFFLPLGLHGRGRGSRALLKKLRSGTLIHDASYFGGVQLEGPEDLLLSVLSAVLVPSPAISGSSSHGILSGDVSGSAMLCHPGNSYSHIIAPVTYMWRALDKMVADKECNSDDTSRQLWVWIHAAAFQEGLDALSSECERLMGVTGRSIHCTSLEGQLGKLELMGSKATQLLQKILQPLSCISGSSLAAQDNKAVELEDQSILRNEDPVLSSGISSLTVSDPRILANGLIALGHEKSSSAILVPYEDESRNQTTFTVDLEKPPLFCAKLGRQRNSELISLWDVSRGIRPPVEESVLCMEKHQCSREYIRLSHKSCRIQNDLEETTSRSCPLLLLSHGSDTSGASAIGLREKHWVAGDVGLPNFPLDFPDSKSYSCFMAMEARDSDLKRDLLPPSVRPLMVPIPPPWNSVRHAFDKNLARTGNCRRQGEELCTEDNIIDNPLETSNSKDQGITAIGGDVPLEGFVARTSLMLNDFLSEMYGSNLVLFPRMLQSKDSMYKFMKDQGYLKQRTNEFTSALKHGQTLCFVRVLLHAYKEGVFEQGAAVCAPDVSDVRLWTDRSELNNRELQLPPASLKSLFVQQPSGEWELQIPEDLGARESYREVIGFVTTGFVRGSKKAVASSLCEASLLSRLREEQWKAVSTKRRGKEIYVLVRNLRSTAYRVALATIVLEQQEEDLDYI